MRLFSRLIEYAFISAICLGAQWVVVHRLDWGWTPQLMTMFGYVVFTQAYFLCCRFMIWQGRATNKGFFRIWLEFNLVLYAMTILRSALNGHVTPPGAWSMTYATVICAGLSFLLNNYVVFRRQRERIPPEEPSD